MTQRMGWAQPEQRLEPHIGGEPPAHSYAEQGIVLHINLQGTPLPVYGCVGSDGTLWRITPDMSYEDRLANLLKWESEFGQTMPRLTQAEAVDLIGPNANFVYNPWVSSRTDMAITTPDGWSRLFPDRKDYTQTKLVEPKPVVQPQLTPAPAQQSFPFPETTTMRIEPDPRPEPGYPANVTFGPLPEPSFWDKVKSFFARLFGRG